MSGDIIKDKDIISDGDLQGPRAFFQDLGAIRILLYRMQNECDVHANALATQALSLLDEALKPDRV
ncbi:hypothetical protein LCGC14_2054500 [marine sediment metagenome]|uniref:Uncharacterized protein n=1 Tax=marine sediment metagenome TaxID=412755 RepID=A0A0F9EMY8_9ZZZZ